MKKLFTIDDFVIAFVSALGYGIGETVPRMFGCPELLCVAVGFAVGILLEEISGRAVLSKTVQKRKRNRALAYGLIVLAFLAGHFVSVRRMGVSLVDYLLEEFLWVVGLPVLGFFVTMLIRGYRARKIRELYGDGSEGFVFDVDDAEIEEVNRQNRPVTGEYDTELSVKTRTGVYVGEKKGKITRFLGIPYAKPPVGGLRWKAPEPLPSSEAVFEAKHFGASAMQVEQKGIILKLHRQSEDCLTLNIFTGKRKPGRKKPVLVLFHHGDFTCGGSVDPLLYGDEFAAGHPDILFVSFNYRLGIFGFIDLSEVPGGEAYPDSLNLGLLDQVAALEWIRENISAFGGDPDRVTVIGFEAGATSICLLAASKRAKGLFRRAFVFNGSLETVYDTPEGARALARKLLEETKTTNVEELLSLDAETLRDAGQRHWLEICAPTCDGTWIPGDVYRAYREGAASGIEFIIGIPKDERHVLRSFFGNRNYRDLIAAAVDDMKDYADGTIGDEIRKYVENYPESPDVPESGSELVERWAALNIYRSADQLAEGGNKVRLLYWDGKPLIENLGAGSVDAAAALLGNREALELYGNVLDADVSGILQALLEKFVCGKALKLYHNEIKGVDAIEWKAFPKALIVSDDSIRCGKIEDRITGGRA